jgi:hypothetical protein
MLLYLALRLHKLCLSYTVVLNSSPLIGETVGGLSVPDMAPDAEYVNLVCDE